MLPKCPKWPSSYYTFKTAHAKTTSSNGTPPPSSMHLCHCIQIIKVWQRKTIKNGEKHPTGKTFTTLTNKSLRTTTILTRTRLTLRHSGREIYCSLPHEELSIWAKTECSFKFAALNIQSIPSYLKTDGRKDSYQSIIATSKLWSNT